MGQFAQQRIELGIGDLGRIGLVIEASVMADDGAQLVDAMRSSCGSSL